MQYLYATTGIASSSEHNAESEAQNPQPQIDHERARLFSKASAQLKLANPKPEAWGFGIINKITRGFTSSTVVGCNNEHGRRLPRSSCTVVLCQQPARAGARLKDTTFVAFKLVGASLASACPAQCPATVMKRSEVPSQ